MKTIVITGSTRGIGLGLAHEFLKRGHRVAVCGRSQESTDRAINELATAYDVDRVWGQPCDVADYDQVQALWDGSKERFGTIDIWINNAGLSNKYKPAWEQPPTVMESTVKTNLLGVMYGTTIAYHGMLEQGSGFIYNMEGFGSNGNTRSGLTIYGSTKRGTHYFTGAFIKEMPEHSPVKIGRLQPGMVATDLVTKAYDDPAEFEKYRRILNIITEPVEVVVPWLVDRILVNQKQGAAFTYSTTPRILWKFLTAPFNKRNVFEGMI